MHIVTLGDDTMIHFTKMHGLGNDYVFVDCTENKNYIPNPSSFSKIISNRNFGIGSDGLILIEDSKLADFKMRIFNSDGSEAEMCGNGIRCVGKYVYDNHLTEKNTLEVETLAGIKKLNLKVRNNQVYSISVCLGNYKVLDEFDLSILDATFTITPVSGLANYGIFVGLEDGYTGLIHISEVSSRFVKDLSDFKIEKYAPLIEKHTVFPNKTNVEFVQIINSNHLKVKVWERGSGITLACGTGACASTAAAFSKKFIYRNPTVELPGGFLQTYIDEKTNSIYLSGPAVTVYNGVYYN